MHPRRDWLGEEAPVFRPCSRLSVLRKRNACYSSWLEQFRKLSTINATYATSISVITFGAPWSRSDDGEISLRYLQRAGLAAQSAEFTLSQVVGEVANVSCLKAVGPRQSWPQFNKESLISEGIRSLCGVGRSTSCIILVI